MILNYQKVKLHILYHCKSSKETPFIICYSDCVDFSEKQKYIICAALSVLVYRKKIAYKYICTIPDNASSPTVQLAIHQDKIIDKNTPQKITTGSVFIAIRGTWSMRDIHTNYKIINNSNLYVDLRQINQTVIKIENLLKHFVSQKNKLYLTGHSAGALYTIKLLNNFCYRFDTEVYYFNPAIIKSHIKQLGNTISTLHHPKPYIKVCIYRSELDIVSYQFRVCQALCDKKWMKVKIIDLHRTHSIKQNSSWINEVLDSHSLFNFIDIRERLYTEAIISEIQEDYQAINKKFQKYVKHFLLAFKFSSMCLLVMLQSNLIHYRTNNKLHLATCKKKKTKPKSIKTKKSYVNIPKLFENYYKQLKKKNRHKKTSIE